jgi:hypothetical protein
VRVPLIRRAKSQPIFQRGLSRRVLISIVLPGGDPWQGGPQLFSGFHVATAITSVTCVIAALSVLNIEPGPLVDFLPRD